MRSLPDAARSSFLALGLGLLAPACEQDARLPELAGASAPAAQREPTPAAALERARQYWASAEKGDWIATYDLLAPELQREQPAAVYLQRKANHIYENMRVVEVVAQKDDQIFLRVTGQWTSNHPKAREVKLEPGQTLTRDVEMIELWRWVGDQWCLLRPLTAEDFLEQYPELQPKPTTPVPAASK